MYRVEEACPRSWTIYFPGEEHSSDDRRAQYIRELCKFFDTEEGWDLLLCSTKFGDIFKETVVVYADFIVLRNLISDTGNEFLYSNLVASLDMQPQEGLVCLAAAAHEALSSSRGKSSRVPELGPSPLVVVHLTNYEDSCVQFKDVKSNLIGKLATIKGTVVRVSAVRPNLKRISFTCSNCGYVICTQCSEGKYKPPVKCTGQGCRSRSFIPEPLTARYEDSQKVRFEENSDGDDRELSQIPRTVECVFTGGLVDTCVPGDMLIVCGVVSYTNGAFSNSKARTTCYLLYLQAVSVVKVARSGSEQTQVANNSSTQCGVDPHATTVGISPSMPALCPEEVFQESRSLAPSNVPPFKTQELLLMSDWVRSMSSCTLEHLVFSLCPAIRGHELVKCGLLLSMFGGVRKYADTPDRIPVRGDIHVLLVGDPGLGKSQMLKAVAKAAPRGLYVCGNTTSSAGLTVAVVRDSSTGEFSFEAGAVVMGDQGVCCVDEFDKMPSQHQDLLEAMEQQSVSVSKAGLVASLSARTSVVAAANPVAGHYNRSKSINENLKMSPAILSRFDLLYILIDKHDGELDRCQTEQVMQRGREPALHSLLHTPHPTLALPPPSSSSAPGKTPADAPGERGPGGDAPRRTLKARLEAYTIQQEERRLVGEDSLGALSPQALQRYVTYARQYVFPTISEPAAEVLHSFYLQLRTKSKAIDGTPITARQLESLVRLAEARARLELTEEVTEQHAMDVVELMREALWDQFADGAGGLDFGRSAGRSGKRGEARRFLAAMVRVSESEGKQLFTRSELYQLAAEVRVDVKDLEQFIEQLNEHGDLLKAGRLYRCAAASTSAAASHYSQAGPQPMKRSAIPRNSMRRI